MSKNSKSKQNYEDVLGLEFHDPDLLTQALTHRSYVNEFGRDGSPADNERLEFLGDAVLDILVADLLYRKFPDVSEGELTQLRAALVKTDSLAYLGRQFHVGEYLRIGHGEEISGGRQRATILCRAFEAIIGAVYLDRDMDAVRALITPSLLDLLDHIIEHNLHIDARSELQERIQARLHITPRYRVAGADGPEHAREFRVEVAIGDSIIAAGIGSSKRAAAQQAARAALQQLEAQGLPENIDLSDQPD